ncbi:fatty-acid--CoA ligase, partial [Mycobacterium sp. M1]|nr:fatty-acid--CoA ligase [Mycolicibacter acidiphilus]
LLAGRGAVFSVEPIEGAGERLVVVQELNRQLAAAIPDLRALLVAAQSAIVRHHGVRAHALMLVEQGTIPTTSSGKIQRRATRQRYLDGEFTALAQWQAPPGSDDDASVDPALAAQAATAMQQAVAAQFWKSLQG